MSEVSETNLEEQLQVVQLSQIRSVVWNTLFFISLVGELKPCFVEISVHSFLQRDKLDSDRKSGISQLRCSASHGDLDSYPLHH